MTKINVKYIPTESKVWVHRYIAPPNALEYLAPSMNRLFKEIF